MEELRLRPALRAYAIVYLSSIALFIAAAFIANAIPYGFGPVVAVLAAVLSLFLLFKLSQRAYLHMTTVYIVSDSVVTQISGIWATDETHVPISKIQNYKIDRSFLGKLIGVATIGMQTARAERGFEMVLRDIPEKGIDGVKAALGAPAKE